MNIKKPSSNLYHLVRFRFGFSFEKTNKIFSKKVRMSSAYFLFSSDLVIGCARIWKKENTDRFNLIPVRYLNQLFHGSSSV